MPFTASDVPDLHGHTIAITGANSGIGFEASRLFARKGARVVLCCRNASKGREAVDTLHAEIPDAQLDLMQVDLASLQSVRDFTAAFCDTYDELHVLVNNAGVMAIPRRETADGFEMTFGTNHLGHFLLDAGLMKPLLATPGARVVTVSSNAHKGGRMRWNDLQHNTWYERWNVYCQSKLANLLFAFELDRRFKAHGHDASSLACHPGYTNTNLQFVGPQMDGSRLMKLVMKASNSVVGMDSETGALPTVRAATDPAAKGGDYYGPNGIGELRGPPIKVKAWRRARSEADARRLWEVSTELTGADWSILG